MSVPRVLIVDDSAFMRSRIRRRLESAGMEVAAEARDGKEAAELYAEVRPDVVTMDLTMRGHDGIVGCRAILEADADARIVLFSIVDDEEVLQAARDSGVTAVVHKSRPEDLVAELRKLSSEKGDA